MHVARTRAELERYRAELLQRRGGEGGLGLVPTMGALHAGHMALVAAARSACSTVAASIFVNPTQFGPGEDLAHYPRTEARDLQMLEAAGCDLVWLPDVAAMYPPGDAARIDAGPVAQPWEGVQRPGHFTGVATVCAKLFGQVGPSEAFFGEKDWQQLVVVRRMVTDLCLRLQITGIPTVREPDGLAMSSRNVRLTASERDRASLLPTVLGACAARLQRGDDAALPETEAELVAAGFRVDYLALIDGETLASLPAPQAGSRLIVAARMGTVRLLDNMPVDAASSGLGSQGNA